MIGENEVSVPTHLYKVIIAKKENQLVMGSFIVPNKPIGFSHHLKDFQVAMEYLEKKTGVVFHSELDRYYFMLFVIQGNIPSKIFYFIGKEKENIAFT